MWGNLCFQINNWAGLMVGSKFTIFPLFHFVCEGNYQVQAPAGLIFGGVILQYVGFFALPLWAQAYTWRGLFSEFYGINVIIIIIMLD